jgi:hypothetical protein
VAVALKPMTTVLASTDQLPVLVDALAQRHAQGLDTYDEWWDGVYRVVTGPTPKHGGLVLKLGRLLLTLAEEAGLDASAPVNQWLPTETSRVLGFTVEAHALVAGDRRYDLVR